MYRVEFPIWRGYGFPSYNPAGSFDNIDDAIDCAKKCYGRIVHNNNIVKSFEIN